MKGVLCMGPKRFLNLKRRENMSGYLFLLPWLLGFLAFFLYPLVSSLRLAFGRVLDNRTFEIEFVGLSNFRDVLTQDTAFLADLISTISQALPDAVLVTVFALFIAILLNRPIRFRGLFRVAFLLPVVLGTGAVMTALQGNNAFAGTAAGMGGVGAMAEEATVSFRDVEFSRQLEAILGPLAPFMENVLSRVIYVMWLSGIQIIIFVGALQTIPVSLYEAALCDGATEWEKFWKITLPLSMPTVGLSLIYTMIDYFGNANNQVVVAITRLFDGNFQFAYASAIAWMYFLVMGIIIGLVMLFLRKRTFTM